MRGGLDAFLLEIATQTNDENSGRTASERLRRPAPSNWPRAIPSRGVGRVVPLFRCWAGPTHVHKALSTRVSRSQPKRPIPGFSAHKCLKSATVDKWRKQQVLVSKVDAAHHATMCNYHIKDTSSAVRPREWQLATGLFKAYKTWC